MVRICKLVLLIDWLCKKINGQILSTARAEKDLFYRFSEKMCTLISDKNRYFFCVIGPIGLKFGRNDPSSGSERFVAGNLDISFFCDIKAGRTQILAILGKIWRFLPDKITKKGNIKISRHKFFRTTGRIIPTKF